jgi:hypothetical protein
MAFSGSILPSEAAAKHGKGFQLGSVSNDSGAAAGSLAPSGFLIIAVDPIGSSERLQMFSNAAICWVRHHIDIVFFAPVHRARVEATACLVAKPSLSQHITDAMPDLIL